MSHSLPTYALVFCLLACGSRQRQTEGPARMAQEPLRSASDGEVMGAQGQPVSDTLRVGATQNGLAPGWEYKDGRLSYDPEANAGGPHAHEECAQTDADNWPPDAGWTPVRRPECAHPTAD